jgi:N-acetylglucosamine-6-sulfatase
MDDMRFDGLRFMPKTRALFDHEFTQARANGGACTDTRLGLFTGTYIKNHPWFWTTTKHGGFDAARTWGPWLQAAGYETGMFGEFITTDVWTDGIQDGWDVWRTYFANPHQPYGFLIDAGETPVDPISPAGRNLDYLMNELITFATSANEPWFASWNPQHPHTVTATGELHPKPEHADRFSGLEWPVDRDQDVTGKPQWIQELDPVSREEELDIQRAARGQAQVLAGVDDAIEDLFATLDAANLLDDTVIFFSSDQGVHYGEHRWGAALGVPAAVQKQTLYEPVVRVPLLAHGPGFPAGSTTVPVSQVDITATVVGIAGATPTHDLDGLDLRTIAASPDSYDDRTVLLQARTFFTPSPDYDALVTGPQHPSYPSRKLARLETGEYEMYDLHTDPGELENVAHDPLRRSERDALEAELDAFLYE